MSIDFQIKILLLAFLATVVLSFIGIPILRRLKVGQNERDDGPKSHIKKQGTPTMGGIIMMISIIKFFLQSIKRNFSFQVKDIVIKFRDGNINITAVLFQSNLRLVSFA